MKKFLIIFILSFSLGMSLYAQLSEGGTPRKVPAFKTASYSTVTMPEVNNDVLRWEADQANEQSGMLKPLTFAHPFEVNLSPLNSGTWYRSDDGWRVWQLNLASIGALSLNLIFEEFHLPPGSRLFIFTPDRMNVIGAFTAADNSDSGVFATAPLPGDKVMVQFEIPGLPEETPDFVITRVNHDFLGILKYTDVRRPMGVTAGECNRDIRCKVASRWENVANSVCRVMVLGKDLCTGTLMNNTALDGKPYILTANHCINTPLKASGSLFLFNYESPYCGSLDGDVTNSLSGSRLKATLDSLDFALVEMTTAPPPSLRPYYAGWNRSTTLTDTLATVHHPQGDIKKAAIDNDRPVNSTFLSSFVKLAFWRILKWEVGTTEIGSSGGPLFNRSEQLVGSLSGGAATCSDPQNDYFVRFDMAWSYKTDSAKQLRHWLDPVGNSPASLNGKQFNTGEDLCGVFTNLIEGDTHQVLKISETSNAYWTGTNNAGITEVAEKFSIPGQEKLVGVSIGIGRKYQPNTGNSSYLTVKVYNLNGTVPVLLTQKDSVLLKNLAVNAMNFIKFNTAVEPADSFLVSIGFDNVKPGDSIVVFQSVRTTAKGDGFWLKKNNSWMTFREASSTSYSGALALELLACNIGGTTTDSIIPDQKYPILVWPNPSAGNYHLQVTEDVPEDMVSVYNMMGQRVKVRVVRSYLRHLELNMDGNAAGFYLIRILSGTKEYQAKIVLVSK